MNINYASVDMDQASLLSAQEEELRKTIESDSNTPTPTVCLTILFYVKNNAFRSKIGKGLKKENYLWSEQMITIRYVYNNYV